MSVRTLNKKPSCLVLDEDCEGQETDVLVGDKFGDVFRHVLGHQRRVKLRPLVRFPLNPPPEAQQPPAGTSAETTDKKDKGKDASDGTLLLGHVSILTGLLLSGPRGSPKRCVITADRDEHIRISRYPQSFIVEGWCLGSKSFINALHLLPPPSPPSESGPQLLFSGGGEDVIRIWDWRTGKCLGSVEIVKIVQPFLRIKRSKWRQETEDDGGDGEEMQDIEMAEAGEDETEHVLAVQKLVSIRAGSTTRIIFSVIG
jgi:tRNA (guanine-N(7)-)-methyltransferase subunit TRM82